LMMVFLFKAPESFFTIIITLIGSKNNFEPNLVAGSLSCYLPAKSIFLFF
jgi:hypothetical protein